VNVPHGRLLAIQYREAAFYTGDGRAGSADVVRVHFRTPDDECHHHDLPNGQWGLQNPALQFMAKWGYKPSLIGDSAPSRRDGEGKTGVSPVADDSAMRDCEDDMQLIPVARNPQEGDWLLHREAMSDAQEALEDAEWFDPDLDIEGDGGPSDGGFGGGSPDPGTGNRGAVDDAEQGGVSAEMAGEDSDAGVEVTVE